MPHSNQRHRLFLDYPIQCALLLRVAGYWAASLLTQALMVFFLAIITTAPNDFHQGATRLWWQLGMVLIGSALVLPMILFDVVRLSHRWVGPVFRLRESMQALSRREKVNPIRFRTADYWQEMAGDFNVIAEELQRQRAELASRTPTEPLPKVD